MVLSELYNILEIKYHLKHLPEFKWETTNVDVNQDVSTLPTNVFGRTHVFFSFKPIDSEHRILDRIQV